jgi:hypothetical protein
VFTLSRKVDECKPLPCGLIRKFFINGVANLLAIVGDCNCNGRVVQVDPRKPTLKALGSKRLTE